MIEQINVYSEMIPFRFFLSDLFPLVSLSQTVTQRATWRWSGREASTRATSPRTTPSRSPSSTTWSGSRRSTSRRLPQVNIEKYDTYIAVFSYFLHRGDCRRSKYDISRFLLFNFLISGEFPGVIMTIVLRRKIQYHLLQVKGSVHSW